MSELPGAQKPLIIVVDDDPDATMLLQRWLELDGFRVELAGDGGALWDRLSRTLPDAICLDIGLPDVSGLDILPLLRKRHSTVPVVILTGDRSVDSVVGAMQGGAWDYLPKPVDRNKLIATLRRAVESHHMSMRIAELERELADTGFGGIIGQSPPMRRLFSQIQRVSVSDITVAIHGESGSGKELVAQAIHDGSPRKAGPFVAVNCAAIPESLQDSELFGHERGAFTGAEKKREGRFEQADGGTLFLDEIGELALPLQAKLLRVLQERRFERVGGNASIHSDFRLVVATHRDLSAMVRDGDFREDLYFRVAVLELDMPPLRGRRGDIPLLVSALIERLTPQGQPQLRVSQAALEVLEAYHWPGNVRELQNALQRAIVMAEGDTLKVSDLPERILREIDGELIDASEEGEAPVPMPEAAPEVASAPVAAPPASSGVRVPDNLTLEELERVAIEQAMVRCQGNVSEVTRQLGIGRTTLYRKFKKFGIR